MWIWLLNEDFSLISMNKITLDFHAVESINNMLDCEIVLSEIEPKQGYYAHFLV